MPTQLQDIGTIELDTEQYVLVRVDDKQAWTMDLLDEPPYIQGEPHLVSFPMNSFHNGALKSREGVESSSEYGQNTDCRFPGRVLPGPKVNTIAGTSGLPINQAVANAIFESGPYVWFCSGQKIYRIDTSGVVVLSKDLTGVPADTLGGIDYNGKPLVTVDDANPAGGPLYALSAIVAGGPDTWTSGTARAWLLTNGVDRIFKITAGGELRNLLIGLNATDESNWADRVQVGSQVGGLTVEAPSGLVAYDRSVLVSRTRGVFAVNSEGDAISIIPPEIASTIPVRCLHSIPTYTIITTNRGTYRFSPGSLESMGLERELLNESPVVGRISSVAFDGRWIYAVVEPIAGGAANYWVITLKEGRGSYGPYVIDTLIHSTTGIHFVLLSTRYSPPRLFLARGTTIDYIELGRGGGVMDPLQSGYVFTGGTGGNYRFTNKINLGWELADLVKIDAVGRNLLSGGTNRTWRIAYSVDGGAYTSLDINGTNMDTTTNGRVTFFVPRTAVGKEFQFRMEYRGTDAQTVGGEILLLEPHFAPRGRKNQAITATLRLAASQVSANGVDHRGGLDQLNDLLALNEQGVSIDTKGPWGDFQCWVRKVHLLDVTQPGVSEPEFVVRLILQKREEA